MKTYINGFSVICAQGQNNHEILANLLAAPKLPQKVTLELDKETYQVNYFPAFAKVRLSLLELVDEIVKQIEQTLTIAQWSESELGDITLFLASTSFAMAEHERRFLPMDSEQLAQSCYQQPFSLNEVSAQLKNRWSNITIINVATSCTSSANALLYAQRYIQLGLIKRAIVVGFESFNAVTLAGFHSLGLLTAQFTPPFSSISEGLILGEGIGCIAISAKPNSPQLSQFSLMGGGMECDTANITTTESDCVMALIQSVLAQSTITPRDIIAVKTHATGSPTNDYIEQESLSLCFDDSPPLLFFKPYIGHTLGACGVLELILLLLCCQSQQLPLNPDYQTINHAIDLPNKTVMSANFLSSGYYLLNYLGFGGNNTILLLEVNQ